jgi:hypothetical protein
MDSRKSRGRADGGTSETQDYEYERFSSLAGELSQPPQTGAYRVQFRRLGYWRPVRTHLLVGFALVFVSGFLLWMMLPEHWPHLHGHNALQIASDVVVISTGLIGLMALINVATLCRASLAARDPIPVTPESGTRVAFLTTIVPAREPLEMVRRTLEAATQIRHDGVLDVWLLDEGGDPAVVRMCEELGVKHFSRAGVERWNQPQGPHRAKSKHGNYNAWLQAHGEDYELLISVDPDHVPLPCFCERFLGYFRDPDVAFVIGPQVYGNYKGFVTRAAESQQFLFHSVLQRAGNRSRTPMLVGTNNAMRISALRQIGGLQDSITEDMATSLELHAQRNPATGERWSSIYTPDLIAVGEGPESFADYYSQQYRWSRGTHDVLMGRFWRLIWHLSPRQRLHYLLLTSYYPTTAVAWLLGVVNGLIYLVLHVGGVTVPMRLWLMLYADAAALQTSLYIWNRRHNVSPHEREGSSGISGMFISALSTPIYVASLADAVLRRRRGFVVTAKGEAAERDTTATFALQLRWAAVIALPLTASLTLHSFANPWMYLWMILALVVCLTPVAIWRVEARRRTRRRPTIAHEHAAEPAAAFPEGIEAA